MMSKTIVALLMAISILGCQEPDGTDTPNPGVHFESETEHVPSSQDTNTKASFPNQIKGNSEKIDIWNTNVDVKIGFIKFDLPNANADQVLKASLRFHVFDVGSPGDVQFYSVAGEWDENELTENNSKDLRFQFEFSKFVAEEDQGGVIEVEITNLVRKWMSGQLANDGLALLADQEKGPVEVEFNSKEAGDKKPLLIIEFVK